MRDLDEVPIKELAELRATGMRQIENLERALGRSLNEEEALAVADEMVTQFSQEQDVSAFRAYESGQPKPEGLAAAAERGALRLAYEQADETPYDTTYDLGTPSGRLAYAEARLAGGLEAELDEDEQAAKEWGTDLGALVHRPRQASMAYGEPPADEEEAA